MDNISLKSWFGLNPLIKMSLIYLMLSLVISETISALSLWWLHIPNVPCPWSFLIILAYHLYWPVAISAAFVLVPAVILFMYVTGGFWRYLGYWLLGVAALISVSIMVGFFLYTFFFEGSIQDWQSLLAFVRSLPYEETDILKQVLYMQLAGFLLVSFIPLFLLVERLRPANKVLGNAHFASGLEIQQARYFKKKDESIIIGKKYGVPLYSNGFEHVLVFAPTGSGKTRSIAIPNLFHYPYSVVCNDVKLTLFETTSGYRQNVLGHTCYCFAPASPNGKTHRFNPLSSISNEPNQRMTDIQRIGHILIPDNPKGDLIWTQASRKLFKALILFLLDSPEHPRTLGELNRLVKQDQFDAWLQDKLDNTEHFDPEFYRNGYSYINNHEKTRSSILETFSGYFELFDDPVIDTATSASDFNFKELRKKKITIYLGFTDEDMERLAPLLTLFWQQLISAMIQEIPDISKEPYPLLCLIDEFSSLGRIERLRRSLKLLREYRVRCILMFQYIAQTYEKYSHDEARAFTNIKTKIAFATEDINDAEFISKMLGTRTKKIRSRTLTNQHTVGTNITINQQAIPLMRPDELMVMPANIELILQAGFAPFKAKQFIWYQESMRKLTRLKTIVPQQRIYRRPFIRKERSYSTEANVADFLG